ncbi:bacterio-opsin activator domain-containing protein [Natrarchaeobius chitinivorans]|uniref:PAS domain S-box protein n=1 Tax=Natrarchaeobius chitinivorans TaxID=1679083 RepID=A0A3N6MPX8_NATCH|nr:bacterio-opsin activator domain-containing protein [Natrarchaeobius chitinivorans]RQG96606.1 PAS domain S-box protein [Natrarchaeobius chitinivorans]
MVNRDDIAKSALETLPITVAVIDHDGEILLTNEAWREFGPGEPDDHVGTDYLATATVEDEHARRAVEGLEDVLDGRRETFAMEYPCHTPDRKQWFLMRANRFRVDGDVRVSIVHLEITERKLAEIDAAESADRLREQRRALEHVLDRVDGLIRDVTDAAVGAGTRDEIERRVCRRLVDTDPYCLAWIGRLDVTSGRIAPSEWAGRDDVPLEDDGLLLGSDERHPAVRAVETDEATVVQNVEAVAEASRWWPVGVDTAVESVAAVPIRYNDVTYGVLVVFADEVDAFDDRELLVLESLAGTIATAMNAIETRRMLTSEGVVELEVAIEDSSLFLTAIASELDASVTFRGQTYDGDGTPLVFLHVDRSAGVVEAVTDLERIADVTTISSSDDGTLLELTLDDGVVTALADHGAVLRRFDTDATVADVALELPSSQSARSVYDLLDDRFDRVELRSYRETERPTETPQDLAARLESSVTDRQLMALRKAYFAGYFAWPRPVSGEELAESMDISRSTFHQHLRAAQRKLLDELFDGDPTSEG